LNSLKAYDIEFSGLKEGVHIYEYQIDDNFLKLDPSDELETVNAGIKLSLEKQSRMLILVFDISGVATVKCDRCLDPLEYNLNGSERLIIKYGNEAYEETEEIVIVPESEHKINIAHYIFEYLHLMLPIRRVHGDDENGKSLCDPEMLKHLSDEQDTTPHNSPWEVLKGLKTENNNS
jgi:uncharacterized protein